jgi:hypothetical protein
VTIDGILWRQHPHLENAEQGAVFFANGYTASIFCKKPHTSASQFDVVALRYGVLDCSVPERSAANYAELLDVLHAIEALPEIEEDADPDYHDTGSDVLNKAQYDRPFDYAVKLITGDTIRFDGVSRVWDGWIHLQNPRYDLGNHVAGRAFERGMDVQLAHVVWAVDAPYGS